MAVSGSATITAPIGPGKNASGLVLTDIRGIFFDTLLGMVQVTTKNGRVISFDANATATITATASSGVFSFTVSQ